jgi:hypothetical protein
MSSPPRWAEALIRLLLEPHERDTVSGDLLEEYRERILPSRGRRAANLWYITQLAGFVWYEHRLPAALLAMAFLVRAAVDWHVPTGDFATRSSVLTAVTAAILTAAGFVRARRSANFRSGMFAGAATALLAIGFNAIGAALLLLGSHDAATLAAIEASGGIIEVFVLPVLLVVPGAVLGLLGAGVATLPRRVVLLGP